MPSIKAVTVYCSSSSKVPRVYFEAADALGRAIAQEGWKLVYGGNACGLMAALADAARAAGGKVIGITPQTFIDKGLRDDKCDEQATKYEKNIQGPKLLHLPAYPTLKLKRIPLMQS